MAYRSYNKLVNIFKEKCPLAYPAEVKRSAISKELDGYCTLKKKKFIIRINKNLDEAAAIDTLIHEWAHGLAWNHLHDSLDDAEFEQRSHDATWGVAYSEVYQIFEKHYIESDSNRRKSKFKSLSCRCMGGRCGPAVKKRERKP